MNSLHRMGRYLRPYRWYMIVGFFTVILPVMMELVVPRMLQLIIDDGIRQGSMAVVWRGSLIMLGATLVGALTTIGQGICRAQISQGLAFDLRSDLFRHIQSLSFANFDQIQTGELMTRISNDANLIRMFFSAGLALLLRVLMMIVGSVIMLLITDWQLSLFVFAALGLTAIVIRILVQVAQPIFHVIQQKLDKLNTIVQENLAGVQVIKAYVRERYEIDRFEASNNDYTAENIRVGQLLAVALPVLTLITNVTMVAVIWRGGIDVSSGRLSVGELIAFVNYLLIGMAPLLFLSNLLTMVTRANVSVERVYEILDTESQLHIADEPYRGEQGVRGEIVFEDVTFQYDLRQDALNVSGLSAPPGTNGAPAKRDAKQAAGHEEVLRGVSFAVAPGQQVALLGATGSGKSTLTSLVPRFYDVSSGRVLIDGIDVRSWDAEALRRQIGGVMQQPTLFHGTIYDNIAYGRADATMEEVVAAAVAAQAHDFILEMADQYESVVEARGANLSGGQKQRIAIARALLISPAILILDDSTSAVDFETEVRIQNALDALMKDRTTLIVAQRISSVLNADQIFVLDQGRIAAQGTHHQLISSSPIYQEIYTSQLGAVV